MINVGNPLAHLADPRHVAESKDRTVTCCICGGPTTLDGFLVAVLKTWNERITRKEDFMTPADVEIACDGECNRTLHRRKHAEDQRENETTRAYLAMLLVGKFNPESLQWLRAHGLGAYVARELAKEGARGT